MQEQEVQFVEIANRLKRGTVDGRVVWERAPSSGLRFKSLLDGGHRAALAEESGGGVQLTMTNPAGAETFQLDSRRVTSDVLRLALLQLFVAARDSIDRRSASEALDAVKDL